jgi:hypothetical protein
MSGEDLPVFISDDRSCEPECFDTRGDFSDLLLGVGARIARIGLELVAGDHSIDAMHEHLRARAQDELR